MFRRYLLETFPYIFSLGNVTKAGPPKAVIEQSWFKMTLVGKGWDGQNSLTTKDVNITEPINKWVVQIMTLYAMFSPDFIF